MSFSLFSTPQQQQSPFQIQQPQQQQSSPFFSQQQTTLFQAHAQQQAQQQAQAQAQQQAQTQAQQQLYLFTNDKAPGSYSTKWADLHPDSQKILLQIEERILEYRDESQRLDQCSRLYDSSFSNDGFELDTSRIVQELGGISTSIDQQKAALHGLMAVAKDMLRNAEVAVRSFVMLRPRFLHPKAGNAQTATQQAPGLGSSATPASTDQPAASSIIPVSEFYQGLPKKPTPFMQQTVVRFEKYLGECRQWIEELEQLFLLDSGKKSNHSSLLQSLPKVMANVHTFFVHVAAKVESIHQYIESMRTAYLADRRRRGDFNDPFLEADRRETAKQEAAAKRIHPTLHLPTILQPSTQIAGLLASSATPGASNATQTPGATATQASSAGGFSLFNTPSSAPSSSLFATPSSAAPVSSLFGQTSSAAPVSSLFGSSNASSQPSQFGSTSASLFGSASAPSLFGSSTPSLTITPPGGFATPFGQGAAAGSGASFGALSKSSRPKSRPSRR